MNERPEGTPIEILLVEDDPGQVEVEEDQVGAGRVGVVAGAPQVGDRLLAVGEAVEVVEHLAVLECLLRDQRIARIVLHQKDLDG